MLAIDLYRHREAHAPSPKEAAVESIIWVMCGLAFGGVIAVMYGGRRVRRVHQRLPDREVVERRQRVRVVDALRHAVDPAEVSAPGAVLGHLRRAHVAGGLHRPGQRADQQVLVAAAGVRRLPGLHRLEDHPPSRRRGPRRNRLEASACYARSCRCPRSSTGRSSSPGSTPSAPQRRCSLRCS